jgi:CRP-like cAMP-binding protein
MHPFLFAAFVALDAWMAGTRPLMEGTATGNELLDLIVRSDRQAAFILRDARLVTFQGGRKLQRAGEPINSCYFPTDGVLALACIVDNEAQINTLTVGFDGAVHAGLGMDIDKARHHVISCLPGQFWEIAAQRWQTLLEKNSKVRHIAAGITVSQLYLLQRSLACQMRHDLESRFCRCLLELHRWQRGRPIAITHLGLSQFLGVRRATITLMARSLQRAGIISCGRGTIEVNDVYALVQASCPCHGIRHVWPEGRGGPAEPAEGAGR